MQCDDGQDERRQLADLVAKIAAHDHEAFEQLYRATHGVVTAAAFRVLGHPDLSAEAAQDTYLQVWLQADRYDDRRGSVFAWLTTLAHHRAVDRLRSRQAAKSRDSRWAGLREAAGDVAGDDAFDRVALQLQARAFLPHLAALSAVQREALRLAYAEQLSHSEIAARLDVPLGTVKGRIRDALLHLRRHTPQQPAG